MTSADTAEPAVSTKTCSRCGATKPLDQFSPRGPTVSSWCRACARDHRRAKRAQGGPREEEYRRHRLARDRALEELRRRHQDEFDAIRAAELARIHDEDAAAR
jgi:ribosome-binding protein aMBF1 (putative translation factor)